MMNYLMIQYSLLIKGRNLQLQFLLKSKGNLINLLFSFVFIFVKMKNGGSLSVINSCEYLDGSVAKLREGTKL